MTFFMRRVGTHADAEDLTQAVFERLLRRQDQEHPSPDGYIFTVAANLLRDRARRGGVRSVYSQVVIALEDRGRDPLDPHRQAAGREAIRLLVAGLKTLPARTRDIFILYRLENIDLDDIAESFGISKSAVKKHVTKAMTNLMNATKDAR